MGKTAEFGFYDQFRLDPGDVLAPFILRQSKRRTINPQRVQASPQVPCSLMRVTGADPPGIAELAVFMKCQGQRADRVWHRRGRCKSRNHKFLRIVTFNLDKVFRTAGAIRRVAQFRNDALKIHVAGMIENRRPSLLEMFGVANRAVAALASQQPLQRRFADGQRLTGEIATVQM